jgi:ferrous iron transport protein B
MDNNCCHDKTLSKDKESFSNDSNLVKSDFVLIGNPNVGKSVLFNALTGMYVDVSNYPGTTVDIARGKIKNHTITDTPGIYGVGSFNEEEIVARAILLKHDKVVNIVSAVSLERDLFLTQQLIDMGYSLILVVNQVDEATAKGIQIDYNRLKQLMGIEVFPTVAIKKTGVEQIKNNLNNARPGRRTPEILKIIDTYRETGVSEPEIVLALEADPSIQEVYPDLQIPDRQEELYTLRRNHINNIVSECVMESLVGASFSTKLGHLLLNPVWGSLAAILVLIALYQVVGVFVAGNIVGVTEGIITDSYIPWMTGIVEAITKNNIIIKLLAGEFGVLTMTVQYIIGVLLPLVAGFYMFFALLEDSGYLPRLAVLCDRFFNKIGLNGKAIIPILLGFGCVTMAIISSRMLTSKKERIIAIAILALTVPCSAQFGIIIALLAATSTPWAWAVYLITIISIMILVSMVLNKYLPGESSGLILDLPPMRLPGLVNIIEKALHKTWQFILEAGPLFVLGTFILSVLSLTGSLDKIQEWLSPLVVNFLNLPKETANAFIMGLIRRDFGAAGLATMAGIGGAEAIMTPIQTVVSIVVITLFVPCLAAVLVMFKERGLLETSLLWGFSIVLAFLVGGMLNIILNFIF